MSGDGSAGWSDGRRSSGSAGSSGGRRSSGSAGSSGERRSSGSAGFAGAVGAALARVLLLLYPPSVRRDIGAAIERDIRLQNDDLARSRGAWAAWRRLPFIAASLVANGAGAWREAMRRERSRAGISLLDFKLGLRMMARHPGLTLIGILGMTVAITIGVVFASAVGVVYATLPFEEGERLVAIENWDLAIRNQDYRNLHDYLIWRDELETVEDLGAFTTVRRNLIDDEGHTHELIRPSIIPYTAQPWDDMEGVEIPALAMIVVLLLVVIAANVGTLVYARTATRRSELLVRTALGASRSNLVGQLFVEALVISGTAAALGAAIAVLPTKLGIARPAFPAQEYVAGFLFLDPGADGGVEELVRQGALGAPGE